MEDREQQELEWNDPEEKEDLGELEQDRFTSFMFGHRREHNPHHQTNHHRQEHTHNQSTINYEELMMNIDTLMESVRGLKPLFHKIYPFVEQLWKKK
ncbi:MULTISPECIES: hypothetical protein [Bacillaceae]|uniref:hypothetical protein n=1 Tax=Bacillaceae TaxID=186817 RepID=UPI0011880005|nr:hypothetical protein [Bacillus sp. S3]QCJ41754.1 hypothetical protein FAY30_07560 [Bacillus sp. S3]